MAAEEDESEGEDDLPLEMVDEAARSNKVCGICLVYHSSGCLVGKETVLQNREICFQHVVDLTLPVYIICSREKIIKV